MFRWDRKLISSLAEKLLKFEEIDVYYSTEDSLQSGVLSFAHRKIDCEQLADRLAKLGIAVRAGLHCAPLAHETVGTIQKGTVRVSVSAFNTEKEVNTFVNAVGLVIKK